MATNPRALPSRVEETLAVCPQFRILIVGNTGIGKSSIISTIFNIGLKDIDIAHDRAGEADITREYTSPANPRFILHDSKGFEPGSEKTWKIVEDFIRERCSTKLPLKERVHTIWLCIQTPRTGSRLMESGDRNLFDLACKYKVPVIFVFTKYDILVNEKITKLQKRKVNPSKPEFPKMSGDDVRAGRSSRNRPKSSSFRQKRRDLILKRIKNFFKLGKKPEDQVQKVEDRGREPEDRGQTPPTLVDPSLSIPHENLEKMAEDEAAKELGKRIEEFADIDFKSVKYVKVSTNSEYKDEKSRLEMLRELTTVTRNCLRDVEGDLLVTWATAQQINAQQKVNYSIDEGFKKYWIDLGKSTIFEGQVLWDCISRIHRDILEVWNFYDPDQLLSGDKFCTEMIKLIEPLLKQPEPQSSDMLSQTSDLVSIGTTIAAAFGQVLGAAGIAAFVVKFLYGRYQTSSLTSLCFGAYIVDLTLILHNLFLDMLTQDPPRPVSRDMIHLTLEHYKTSDAPRTHGLVRDIVYKGVSLRPEVRIADLIRKELKMETIK